MPHKIVIQKIISKKLPINQKTIKDWIKAAFFNQNPTEIYELCLRIVDTNEIHQLNKQFRKKNKPTNVLAFPNSIPEYYQNKKTKFLGDIIICPEVLEMETNLQQISLDAHWAHIIIHGILHLFGFDHQDTADTLQMQQREIAILAKIGYDDPYQNYGI